MVLVILISGLVALGTSILQNYYNGNYVNYVLSNNSVSLFVQAIGKTTEFQEIYSLKNYSILEYKGLMNVTLIDEDSINSSEYIRNYDYMDYYWGDSTMKEDFKIYIELSSLFFFFIAMIVFYKTNRLFVVMILFIIGVAFWIISFYLHYSLEITQEFQRQFEARYPNLTQYAHLKNYADIPELVLLNSHLIINVTVGSNQEFLIDTYMKNPGYVCDFLSTLSEKYELNENHYMGFVQHYSEYYNDYCTIRGWSIWDLCVLIFENILPSLILDIVLWISFLLFYDKAEESEPEQNTQDDEESQKGVVLDDIKVAPNFVVNSKPQNIWKYGYDDDKAKQYDFTSQSNYQQHSNFF